MGVFIFQKVRSVKSPGGASSEFMCRGHRDSHQVFRKSPSLDLSCPLNVQEADLGTPGKNFLG